MEYEKNIEYETEMRRKEWKMNMGPVHIFFFGPPYHAHANCSIPVTTIFEVLPVSDDFVRQPGKYICYTHTHTHTHTHAHLIHTHVYVHIYTYHFLRSHVGLRRVRALAYSSGARLRHPATPVLPAPAPPSSPRCTAQPGP